MKITPYLCIIHLELRRQQDKVGTHIMANIINQDAKRELRQRVGAIIRTARNARELSVVELSNLTGVDKNQICRIEAGRTNATIDTIGSLAEALNLQLSLTSKSTSTMKTQISDLINGSEFTIRDLNAEKYTSNPIGFYNGHENTPKLGGTPTAEREAVASKVALENPAEMHVRINGVDLTLLRHTSASGKSWRWTSEITPNQYEEIVGSLSVWTHKGATNAYEIEIAQDCTVTAYAMSGRKGFSRIIGEEFVAIL